MYEYLKNFDNFYKYYILFYKHITEISHDNIEHIDTKILPDTHELQEQHRSISSIFCNIIDHYEGDVDYAALMYDDKHLFDNMTVAVKRHFNAGVKFEFLISGLNILTSCFCEMTAKADMENESKISMLENLRKISNAYLVVTASAWSAMDAERSRQIIKTKDDTLNSERERFMKYIDSRKSLIVFIDDKGCLLRLNLSARRHFDINLGCLDYNIMDIFDYHFISFDMFINKYNNQELKPVRLMNGERFDIGVFPLIFKEGKVTEYVVTLKKAENRYLCDTEVNQAQNANDGNSSKLTHTETNICMMIEDGLSSKEIAAHLNIAIDTVKTHRKNIRKKLRLQKTGTNMYIYLKKNDII